MMKINCVHKKVQKSVKWTPGRLTFLLSCTTQGGKTTIIIFTPVPVTDDVTYEARVESLLVECVSFCEIK